MEEILSSIKRIIAEDKAIDDAPAPARKKIAKPKLQAVPDVEAVEDDDEILELTEEIPADEHANAQGVFGDRRKEDRLIDDNKLDAMRESLSALVSKETRDLHAPVQPAQGTSLEDLTRELMRPMLKEWLDENLPSIVEELVAREIARLGDK